MPRIAVIGAGMAGATVSRLLRGQGIDVEVFDKSRGTGGRMATRYTDSAAWDHGAQFFTARTPAFQDMINHYQRSGLVQEWSPKVVTLAAGSKPYKRDWFESHYVASPQMNALCRALLEDIPLHTGKPVTAVTRIADQWQLSISDEPSALYDWVICSAPAEQTMNLLPAPLEDVAYEPCFALLGHPRGNPHLDAAVIKDSVLSWLCTSGSRPGRDGEPTLIAHSTGEWAAANFDDDPGFVKESMIRTLKDLGVELADSPAVHRWRYARVSQAHHEPYWLDSKLQLAACGDWGLGNRVEDAFTSAHLLGSDLIRKLIT